MKLNTSRFGEIEVAEDKFLRFDEGIPGFEDLKRFILISNEETDPFHWFQSIDSPDIALAVIDPTILFPDYDISVPVQTLADLGIGDGDDMWVLTVAVVPREFQNMTANLVSPIIINPITNRGRQVILENTTYLIRQPIFEALQQYVTGGAENAGTDS